jgi:hypothetical protein
VDDLGKVSVLRGYNGGGESTELAACQHLMFTCLLGNAEEIINGAERQIRDLIRHQRRNGSELDVAIRSFALLLSRRNGGGMSVNESAEGKCAHTHCRSSTWRRRG